MGGDHLHSNVHFFAIRPAVNRLATAAGRTDLTWRNPPFARACQTARGWLQRRAISQ
jgi:hypothetical protein